MKSRQGIQQALVQLQQRLLHERQQAAGHAAREASLAHVRSSNHAALRQRCESVLAMDGVGQASDFFFEQLYPVAWPRWRDEQCLRTFPRMCRVMPLAACEVLLRAVELDWLTHELDARMTAGEFDDAGRLRQMRRQQRDAVVELGRGLAAVARLPMMTLLLRCAGPVARRQGLGELHAFFTAGLAASLTLPDPGSVLDLLESMDV